MEMLINKDLVEAYVRALFASEPRPGLLYHNLVHTATVVDRCKEIGEYYQLPEQDFLILVIAAWFHDVGHLDGPVDGHEQRSVIMMREFLKNAGAGEHLIVQISNCILATRYPPAPQNLLGEIICDADSYHLGTTDFIETDRLVWAEMEKRKGILFVDKVSRSLRFLEEHQFFTGYCKNKLESGKALNIEILRQKVLDT